MKKYHLNIGMLLLVFGSLLLGSCKEKVRIYEKIEPAHIDHQEGHELSTLTLKPKAAERLGIETVNVQEAINADGTKQSYMPYGSILYTPDGRVWVFKNPKPLVYVRHEIKVDHITNDQVYVTEGPPVGTAVVTFGAAELFGTEFHVGH